MLDQLAQAGTVAEFYRGEIAERIAKQSNQNGGLLTADDLQIMKHAWSNPLSIEWNGFRIYTPPPTSGGLTVLQVLAILKALGWPKQSASREIELVEASRVAWSDRLTHLGDPKFSDLPIKRLLAPQSLSDVADRIRTAIKSGSPLATMSDGRSAGGTIHLNAMDQHGLTASLTFTHGDSFGAQVTVDGLGLLMGHGLSRFDPRPGRPNSPGP